LAEQLLGYFRDLLMATVDAGADLLRFVAADDYPRLQAIGRSLGSAQLLAIVGLLDQSIVRMRQSLHSRVLLEVALVQISSLPDLQQLRDVLEGYALPEEEKKKPLMPTAATALGGSVATVERPPGGRAAATVAATESPAAPIAIASSVANRSDEAARSESSDPRPYPSPAIVLPSVERRSPIDRTNERAPPIVSESGDAPAHSQSVPPVDLVMEAVVGDGEQEPPARSVDSPGDMSHRLQAAWQAMLDQLEDLTADAARPAQQVQWIDPGRVRVVFPADKQLSLRSCERPDRRARLERELAQRLEAPISLEFTALPATQAVMPASPRLGTHQRLQERRAIEADPLVRRVMELFNAEITRVDTAHPGPAGGAGAAAAPKAAPRPADPVASVRTSAAEEVASDDDDV
jgi:DNA polymerase-3 subunit gamma/tau